MRPPALSTRHLERMTTLDGLYEHADHTLPRLAHGYCLDDVARGLVLTSREPDPSTAMRRLATLYLRFVLTAQDGSGRFRNRRRVDGVWRGRPSAADHWGRAVWALGTTASSSTDEQAREQALRSAVLALGVRSHWSRSTAYAALGAAEVQRSHPGEASSLGFLREAAAVVGRARAVSAWPWPEPRLAYANAVIPEALMAIGDALADGALRDEGMDLLRWLVAGQMRDGHLSVTPVGGWGPGDPRPGFDQQPIEVVAIAEAAARALRLTGDAEWLTTLESCVAWFLGANDSGLTMYADGGGYDGLGPDAVNLNQGAESTLAALSTFQLARLAAMALSR